MSFIRFYNAYRAIFWALLKYGGRDEIYPRQ